MQLPKRVGQSSELKVGTPILLYQAFYTLLHELKTSVGLSDSSEIRALSNTVAVLEKDLKRLAYDELELSETENAALLAFVQKEFDLAEARHLLEGLLAKGEKTAELAAQAEKLLAQALPWDSLSKARAKSAARHGYTFWSKNDSCELSTLLEHHDRLMLEIFEMSGVPVLRKLDSGNSASSDADSSSPMQLIYSQFAAFLPTAAVTRILEPLRWTPVA